MIRREALIGFAHGQWTARLDEQRFYASEWKALREQLVRFCRQNGAGQAVRIYLRFDMRDIPRWFHQYQTHYFNEIIELKA